MASAELVVEIKAEIDELKRAFQQFRKQLDDATRVARESPFKRWVADLSHLYISLLAIRDALRASPLADWVRRGIDFNKTLEQTKIGIAGILTSVGKVTTETGKLVEGGEKFSLALKTAGQLQKKLQKEAMASTATYQELVQIMQGIMAPGLSAGLNLDQVLELTVLMSNAVKALGLDLGQAVQESRDLLQGTIDMNSQLARSLGITNDMVKSWREQGRLFEEITKRLEGFKLAGIELQKSWEGLFSNLQDMLDLLAGETFKPLFEAVKRDLKEIISSLVEVDEKTKRIRIKADVRQSIQNLGRQIVALYEFFKDLVGIVKALWDTFGGAVKEGLKLYGVYLVTSKLGPPLWGLVNVLKQVLVYMIGVTKTYRWKALIVAIRTARREVSKLALSLKAGLIAMTALIGYEIGSLINKWADKITKGMFSYVIQKAFLFVDSLILEIRRGLGALRLPGGVSEEEYRKKKQALELMKADIERTRREFLSAPEVPRATSPQPEGEERDLLGRWKSGAESAQNSFKALSEEWEKTRQRLEQEIGTQGVDQYTAALIELEAQYRELKETFKDIPEALSVIEEWFKVRKEQIEFEKRTAELKEEAETQREWVKEIEDLNKKRAELEEWLTERLTSEVQRRLQQLEIEKDRGIETLLEAYGKGLIDFEELQRKMTEVEEVYSKRRQEILEAERRKKEELSAQARLTQIQLAERRGEISPVEALRLQLDIYRQLAETAQQRLSALSEESSAYYEQLQIFQQYQMQIAELQMKLQELTGTFDQGFVSAIRRAGQEMASTFRMGQQLAQQLVGTISNTLSQAIYDAFTGRLKDAKDYLRSFAQSMLQFLSQLIAKLIIVKSLQAAGFMGGVTIGFASGGIVEGLKLIRAYQTGGIVEKPTLALIGEGRHKEAIVPLPDGRHIPAIVKDSSEPSEVVVVNVLDQSLMEEFLTSRRGRKVIRNIIRGED